MVLGGKRVKKRSVRILVPRPAVENFKATKLTVRTYLGSSLPFYGSIPGLDKAELLSPVVTETKNPVLVENLKLIGEIRQLSTNRLRKPVGLFCSSTSAWVVKLA